MSGERSLLAPFYLRSVHIGVQATVLVVGLGSLFAALPGHGVLHMPEFAIILGVALAGGLMVLGLPWAKLLAAGREMGFFYIWTISNIALITLAIGVNGGASSDIYLLYSLTTIYFGTIYPPRAQLLLLAFTYSAYTGVLYATGWEITPGALVIRLGGLGVLAFIGRFLTSELMRHMTAHWEARAESERRAALLATVTRAAREMSTLESDRVLATVVESAGELGFEAACLCVYQQESGTFRVEYARGLPPDYVAAPLDGENSMPGRALREERVLVMSASSGEPPPPRFRQLGFRVAVAAPVRSQGRIVAVLGAGSRHDREITDQHVGAMELLAAHAGAALDNARRFEDEHRMVERLAELDRLKQNFLSTVSHEFRTPLAVIRGMNRTLAGRWRDLDDEVRADLLDRMNANVETLDGIIATLLDYSRLEAGRLEAHQRPVQVREAIRSVVRRLATLLAEHHVEVEAPESVCASADPTLLDRVLENLLSNASKYTPPGTRVVVSAHDAGDGVVVSVADTGPGIGPEDLAHLGERFFRAGDPNSRPRGTGLGLALVREICELHGGKLDIESEPGRGARFSFTLPEAGPAAGAASA